MAGPILSSSLRVFGVIAYARTGSGNSIGGISVATDLSPSVSPVCVSFSLATAPMSPACSSGTCTWALPSSTSRCPNRSAAPRVRFCTALSAFSTPDRTRNNVMRPAN